MEKGSAERSGHMCWRPEGGYTPGTFLGKSTMQILQLDSPITDSFDSIYRQIKAPNGPYLGRGDTLLILRVSGSLRLGRAHWLLSKGATLWL